MSHELNIYVVCLAAYNNGKLHGRWIDATMCADDIRSEIADMLKTSPESDAEEYAIHDYEVPGKIKIGAHEDIDEISEIAELIEKYGDAFIAAYGYEPDVSYAETLCRDHYCGHHEDTVAFMEQYADDTCMLSDVPDSIKCYIDYEAMARDAFINDFLDIDDQTGGVHVFYRY